VSFWLCVHATKIIVDEVSVMFQNSNNLQSWLFPVNNSMFPSRVNILSIPNNTNKEYLFSWINLDNLDTVSNNRSTECNMVNNSHSHSIKDMLQGSLSLLSPSSSIMLQKRNKWSKDISTPQLESKFTLIVFKLMNLFKNYMMLKF
jgi:hypothetical protein